MIVEISGRQTGKTTRMIEHMAHKILYGSNSITIICWSVLQYRYILSRLEDKLIEIGGDDWRNSHQYLNTIVKRGYDMRDDHTFYYIDEFDFLDETLMIRHNAYYVTSIRRNTQFSNDLVRYCRSNNIEIYHTPFNNNVLLLSEEIGGIAMDEIRTMSQFYDVHDLFLNIKLDFTPTKQLLKFKL